MSEKNIYQRINMVMGECDYLQKEKAGVQGKGVKYDTVIAMLRPLLIKHGIVMVVRQNSFEHVSGVEGTKQKIYQGSYELDLVNVDNPDDKVSHTAFSHGMDGGDKSPGKAQTYAVKILLVKGFGLETGEDDESRSEKIDRANVINQFQCEQLWGYCVDNSSGSPGWSEQGTKILNAYNIGDISHLPASKFAEVLAICKSSKA